MEVVEESKAATGQNYVLDVNKHARYFQMVLNGIPSKSQDMQRALLAYFCLCGLDVLGELHRVDKIRPEIVSWLRQTQKKTQDCGFRGGATFAHSDRRPEANDLDTPHLTMTSVSLLSLIILGEKIDRDSSLQLETIAESMARFQLPNGCFQATLLPADEFDVRFAYSAACIHAVFKMVASKDRDAELKKILLSSFNLEKLADFLATCMTYEGAFTVRPDLESHAGGVYCALAALKLTDQLERVLSAEKRQKLVKWLLRRQNTDGGFNGRPNKPSDSCYFFWVGASLAMLDAVHLVDPQSVIPFCRSVEDRCIGGFSKLPGSTADPLHAYLTLAGLSLFGTFSDTLAPVDPALCCPQRPISQFSATSP